MNELERYKLLAEHYEKSYRYWRTVACTSLGILVYLITFIIGYLLIAKK